MLSNSIDLIQIMLEIQEISKFHRLIYINNIY